MDMDKAEAKEDRRAAMSEALQLAGVNAGSGMTAQQAKEFVIKPVQVMIDGVRKKLTEVRDTSTASQAGEAAAAPEDGYTWGGQSGRSVPEGFTLSHSVVHPTDPNKIRHRGLTVLQGWQLWNVGNIAAGKNREPVGPYRELLPWGLHGPPLRVRKDMSNFRFVFTHIESYLDKADPNWKARGFNHQPPLATSGRPCPLPTRGGALTSCGAL